MAKYVHDENNNRHEAFDKVETLSAIQEAIASGELPEEINGLVITLKNSIDNNAYKIAFCTQAKYNELEQAGTLETNCYYFITDDTSYDDLISALETANDNITDLQQQVDDLGFKEGTFTLASGMSATTNFIKKQGKRVVATLVGSDSIQQDSIYLSGVTIPEAFRPKENTIVSFYGINGTFPSMTEQHKCVIKTNGTIALTDNSDALLKEMLSVGWELA